ncbi:hypothetical protein HOY80DRAFT_893459 [Tuber brumale]|nr:hypothetical protein HOY80DRAFT_893459 [Tuber brumale]
MGGGGSGSEVRKGNEGAESESEGEGGGKERGCGEKGEKDGDEGDVRGSGEYKYKGGGVSSDNGVREIAGSTGGNVGISTLPVRHRKGIDQPPAKRSPEPSVTTKGKLLPTPSQLLKLLLPLQLTGSSHPTDSPLALLVHPLQPLSYLQCLIQAELPPITSPNSIPRAPNISFKAVDLGGALLEAHTNAKSQRKLQSPRGWKGEGGVETAGGLGSLIPSEKSDKGGYVRWSPSTEVGDFVRDVARGKEFVIEIEGSDDVLVGVPSFRQRTHYLRQRLVAAAREIELQSRIESECDGTAQRVAISGFAGLVGWWVGVYWLTFKTGLGWDVMGPVAYLVGLSTVMAGYLLLLYAGHGVPCRSVLRMDVSKRQMRLYREKVFGVDKWEELVNEGRALRREIKAIAEEYDVDWDERSDGVGGDRVNRPPTEGAKDGEGKDRGTRMWQGEERRGGDEEVGSPFVVE